MEQTSMAVPADPQSSGKGFAFRGLVEVFYQPSAFFQKLKSQPKILVPYIVVGILFAVTFFLISDLVVEMQLAQPEVQERLQGQPITDQIRQFMKYQTMIGGPIVMLFMPLLTAFLAWLVGNFFMGLKNARFKQLLSVALYAGVIYSTGFLLVGLLMVAKGSAIVSLSLGVLATDDAPGGLLYVALSKIDVFNIWEIIVAGIGFSTVYEVARNKGYLISVLSVGMLSILHVVWVAIASAIF